MPYRRVYFEKNQPFHILSRAIEKEYIFNEITDCYRFIFQLYAANLGSPSPALWRTDKIKIAQALLNGEEISSKFIIKEHSPLVHILDFALVKTHYHLYLLPNVENGVSFYMKKLNGGFAKYFNLRHGRKDSLFGSRYKSIPVETDFQSAAVSRYISIINPLDVYQPGWREEGLRDSGEAFKFLENYQFSSFPDKIGKRRAKILAPDEISNRYFVTKSFKEKELYINFVKDFLRKKLISCQPFFLE